MITEEERQEIINAAVEKTLLKIPEVIGSLITNHVALAKINRDFYTKYPEFRDKKDIVASVVEMVEGSSPLDKYDKILERAVPEIRKRLKQTRHLDSVTIQEPKRDLHGVL